MKTPYFVAAITTPLREDENIHEESLRLQLHDLIHSGIDSILVAGSMGAMQLLTWRSYCELVTKSVDIAQGKQEVIIGAGDTSFFRTKERIEFINTHDVDGVAVLSPFFWKYSQDELIEYFQRLADICRSPLYLYDLPQVVGTKLEMSTILKLAEHPNIKGAKVSCSINFSRQLRDKAPDEFRIITANLEIVDMMLCHGLNEQVDGMFAIYPQWTVQLGKCAASGDWEKAAGINRDMYNARDLSVTYGREIFTVMQNARGLPGKHIPEPTIKLSSDDMEQVLQVPIMRKLIEQNPLS